METLEHIKQDELFLKELCRVLKPSGSLYLSTPNALITKPINNVPVNPFHVKEYTPKELQDILNKFFIIEQALGQHVKASYGVVPFLPSFDKSKLKFKEKVNALYWSLVLRLPFKNFIHKFFFNHSFYPTVNDYTFMPGNLKSAHVQYYVLKKRI
jgi:ubiquinone/menaquinone biosynthesis C-methylase UbiE